MKRIAAVLVLLLLLGGCVLVYTSPGIRDLLFPADAGESAGGENSSAQNTLPLPSGNTGEEDQTPPQSSSPGEAAVQALLAEMTLEEKVGQMFFVRCPEKNAAALVSQYHLGGYILFGRDFQDKTLQEVTDTIAAYQTQAEIPLLIGVDEEGGTVVRVSSNPNLFPHRCLSPRALFAQGGLGAIRQDAVTKSETLLSLGINVNFAPVADVCSDPGSFMYDRAFGQDARSTATYVETVVNAMKGTGIGSVLKHFPGYGNNADTHTGVVVDERPYETFTSSEFLPFQAGIAAGADSVLVSHNIVNCMDDQLPASLSPEVHRILREDLGFTGVILTDDLAMDAVEAYAEDGSVAVLAVLAGNDMVVTTDFTEQIPQVVEAVENGTIDESLIDAAVTRVLMWKYNLGLLG